MAKISFKLPDDMLVKMSKLAGKSDEVIKKVLVKGAEPLFVAAKLNLGSAIGRNTKEPSKAKGELLKSLRTTRPFVDKDGNYGIKVGCEGLDSDGVSNAMKAAVLEHGKSNQTPRPWLKPSGSKAKSACIDAMKIAFDDEVSKL